MRGHNSSGSSPDNASSDDNHFPVHTLMTVALDFRKTMQPSRPAFSGLSFRIDQLPSSHSSLRTPLGCIRCLNLQFFFWTRFSVKVAVSGRQQLFPPHLLWFIADCNTVYWPQSYLPTPAAEGTYHINCSVLFRIIVCPIDTANIWSSGWSGLDGVVSGTLSVSC